MRSIIGLILLVIIISCKEESNFIPREFERVEVETILKDSTLSIRAIDILNDGSLAFAANNNSFGLFNTATGEWQISKQQFT